MTVLLVLCVSWFAFLFFYGFYLNHIKEKKPDDYLWWMRPSSFFIAFVDAPKLWTLWVTIAVVIIYNVADHFFN